MQSYLVKKKMVDINVRRILSNDINDIKMETKYRLKSFSKSR